MPNRFLSREFLRSDTGLLMALALVKLLLHFFTNSQYGYFRDEFYYLACGEHLDWGYVDQPPLVAVMAALTRVLLGESLFALRFFPAVAGAVVVFLTGLMVRELGGGRFAQALAAVAVIVAPIYLIIDHIFSMNAFDHLFWALGAYIVIRILKEDRPKLWLLFGLVAGLGLMTKYSMGFFALGLVVGLVLTPARKHFASKWLWLGGTLAFLIFLPHILWQIQHDFPTREFVRNATLYKIKPLSPLQFFSEQILELNHFTLPIWLAGIGYFFFSAVGKKYRLMGWIYVSVLVLFLATRAKVYYLAPAYFMLFAGGALVVEAFIQRRAWNWLKPASLAVLVAGGLISLPMALPVLPVETFIRYQDALGIRPEAGERHRLGPLPQMYADMFGWEEMVATVAKVYHGLPAEEKAKCAIFGGNYGEAGAIDFFGKRYGLPKAISGHNNYWLWGPRDYTGEILITVGSDLEDLQQLFGDVRLGATITHEYAIPYENNLPVYVCRKPKMSLKEVWPRAKDYG